MRPRTFAILLAALAAIFVYAFGVWIGLKPKAAFAGAAICTVSYLAVAIPFIRLNEKRAAAQKDEA